MTFCCGTFANSWIVAVKVNQPRRSFGPAAQSHGQAVPNRVQQCHHPCILARLDPRDPGRSAAGLQSYVPCRIVRRRDPLQMADRAPLNPPRRPLLATRCAISISCRGTSLRARWQGSNPSRSGSLRDRPIRVAVQCFHGVDHWSPIRVPLPASAAAGFALRSATNGSMISRSAVDLTGPNQRTPLSPVCALSSDALPESFVASPEFAQ